jgi:hypothetical protein
MFSEKVEDIPNKSFRALKTSLSELQTEQNRFTRSALAKRSGVNESHALAFLSELCDEGVVAAKLKVRCPSCDQEHGLYASRSDVPSKTTHCFCGKEFYPDEKTNWSVVYEFIEDIEALLKSSESYMFAV